MAQARAFYASGRLQQAGALLEGVLRNEPRNAEATQLLGAILFQLGKPVEGRELVERAIAVDPRNGPAWNSLGLIQHLSGDNERALEAFAKATEVAPRLGEAWMNRGFVLQALGRQEDSIPIFEKALAIGFRHPNVPFFLGNAYAALGRHEEAIAQFDRSLALFRDHADAWNNRGNSLLALERTEEAAESLDRAIDLMRTEAGDDVAKRVDLVRALQSQGRWREAIEAADVPDPGLRFLQALATPVVFESAGEAEEALEHLRVGIERLRKEKPHLDDPMRQVGLTAFQLPYFGISERPIQEALAQLYLECAPSLRFEASHSPTKNRPKLGVMSAMLKKHSVSMIFGGLIERLDPERFELVYLQIGASDPDSERLSRRADRHVVLPSSLARAREEVARQELDILFVPEVGADPLAYYLTFSRFAPIQCTTWGHPLTTGSPTMDYFLSSRHLDREDGQTEYTEKLVRLPSLTAFYARPLPPPEWPRSEFGLPEDRRLYGCLQTAYKFHPSFDRLLAEILERDALGSLVLVEPDRPHLKKLLVERWRRDHAIIAERAIWLKRMPLDRFLRILQLCDALLVPTQFGAGRSALDSLGVGAPLVTLEGPYLKSRITSAAYREIGLLDLIATTEEEYIELALRLANDSEWQAAMRSEVAGRSEDLFESEKAVREFNEFFASLTERL
ncbi:MAG TPA: tetratricopeptide repeat protein [Fimbriimonadaceae bacterium]|nr:tetratricopeptide repeat protein [Fimbriimonadaceae bacterium]